MILGILVCLFAAAVIGGTSFANLGPAALMGCGLALVCALGWGIEGAVAGFGTTLIDYNIGIIIRQITSGIGNTIILLPLLCLVDGNGLNGFSLFGNALVDSSVIFFVISGLSYGFWVQGRLPCAARLWV